jgi:Skp family chaperone for outer membrane proteins
MKPSFLSLGSLALAWCVVSCERRETNALPERSAAVTEAAAAIPPTPAVAESSSTDTGSSTTASGATVDLRRILAETKPAIEARKRLDAAGTEIKSEIEERKKRIQAVAESVGTSAKRLRNPALTTPERETLVKDVNAKRSEVVALEAELKEFVSRREKALAEKTKVELGKVIGDIRARTDALATAAGHLWVMDRSGTTQNHIPVVVYVKPSLPDLTPAVIEAINREAK